MLASESNAFIVEKTSFSGAVAEAALAANQHCAVAGTGSLCTPEFQLIDVDFSGMPRQHGKWIQFGISSGDDVLPSFSTFDSNGASLGGYAGVASEHQTHLLGLRDSGTQKLLCRTAASVGMAEKYDNGILCDRPLRRLQLWRPQQTWFVGPPRLTIKDSSNAALDMRFIAPVPGDPTKIKKQGYGVVVMPGFSYTLSNLEALPGDGAVLEFSDNIYATRWGVLAFVSRSGFSI